MGEKARRYVQENFLITRMLSDYLDLICELLAWPDASDSEREKTGNPEATKAVIQRSPEPQRQADDQSTHPCGPLDCHGAGLWKYRPKPDCEQMRGARLHPSLPAETLFAPFGAASPDRIERLASHFLLAVNGPNLSLHE
jgi:hypothetical protein